MPSVPLHPPRRNKEQGEHLTPLVNPLPHLLQTPSGRALVEIQGTLHIPGPNLTPNDRDDIAPTETPVGRLVFPFYNPESRDPKDQSWMNRVYLYVGKHQRLTGEVKKLPKAIAVIQKREVGATDMMELDGPETLAREEGSLGEQLEIVEIVKYKILFAGRPEPFCNPCPNEGQPSVDQIGPLLYWPLRATIELKFSGVVSNWWPLSIEPTAVLIILEPTPGLRDPESGLVESDSPLSWRPFSPLERNGVEARPCLHLGKALSPMPDEHGHPADNGKDPNRHVNPNAGFGASAHGRDDSPIPGSEPALLKGIAPTRDHGRASKAGACLDAKSQKLRKNIRIQEAITEISLPSAPKSRSPSTCQLHL